MKSTYFALLILILLFSSFIIFSRKSIKQNLPREGFVEVIGLVYTPYLLSDSPLYFLKNLDEKTELYFTLNDKGRAKLTMNFANKRLLELEKLLRSNNKYQSDNLIDRYIQEINKSIGYARKASKNEKIDDELIWFYQENIQDQQKIFKIILDEITDSRKPSIIEIQDKTNNLILDYLSECFRFK